MNSFAHAIAQFPLAFSRLTPEVEAVILGGLDVTPAEIAWAKGDVGRAKGGRAIGPAMFFARLLVITGVATPEASDRTGANLGNLNIWSRNNGFSHLVGFRPERTQMPTGGRKLSERMQRAIELVKAGTPPALAADDAGVTRRYLYAWARNNGYHGGLADAHTTVAGRRAEPVSNVIPFPKEAAK